MLKLRINGSWTQFTEPLKTMTEFDTGGNLKGRKGPAQSYGRLPRSLWDLAIQADYVVYSYQTPIAWHVPGMHHWLSPNVRYSASTTKQQGRIFTALASIDVCAVDARTDA